MPSLLSLLAAGFYVIVACACILAARSKSARLSSDGSPQRRHRVFWFWLAAAFFAFAIMRVLAVEDAARDILRALIAQEGQEGRTWEWRRPVQAGLVLLVSAGGLGAAAYLAKRWRDARGDLLAVVRLAAAMAVAAMLVLMLVRIISLHFTDWLLFAGLIGPVRLNWIIDLGAGVTVLVCALISAKARPAQTRSTGRSVSNYRQ